MKVFVCLTALVAAASAISCPDLSVVSDFNVTAYSGTWYKQYGLNTVWEIGTCSQVTYTENNDTGVIDVATRIKTILGGTTEVSGYAVLADSSSTDGIFNLTMRTYVGDVTAPMWILATDYDNFAIAYHCNDVSISIFKFPFESVWVLTRDRELTVPTALLIEVAMATISDQGGPSMSLLTPASQKNCENN